MGLSKPARTSPVETRLDMVSDPVELAKLTLQAICQNATFPAGARAQAARTLLELAGALKITPVEGRAGAEMSLEEIDARLEALAAQTR